MSDLSDMRKPLWVVPLLVSGLLLAGCESTGMGEDSEVGEELALLPEEAPPAAEPETIFLAEAALEEGRYDDAQVLLERYLFTFPGNPRGTLAAGELKLARGDTGSALRLFRGLLEEPEVSSSAEQGYGITLLLVGEDEIASEHLRKAVEADPTLWRAWNGLGAYYDSIEDWPASEDSYRRALALRPNEAMILNNLGFSLLMQGKVEESLRPLEEALRLDNNSRLIKTNLRIALAQQGQYRRAVRSTSDDVDLAMALNNVGYIALLRGDYDHAEAYFTRAMEVDPTFNEIAWRNLKLLNNLRDESEELGQLPPAIN